MPVIQLAALTLATLASPATDAPALTWRGERYDATQPPATVPPAAAARVAEWAPWAADSGYQLHLSDDARTLLAVHPSRASKADEDMAVLERTRARFEAIVAQGAFVSSPGGRTRAVPASAPSDAPPEGAEPVTVVVLETRTQADYRTVTSRLASEHAYLADWATGSAQGFALEVPLVAATVEEGPGLEEWSRENELAHRMSQLLLFEHFGRLPYWLSVGFAWTLEEAQCKSIYCFPARDGFVGITEHGGWGPTLRSAYKKRKKDPVRIEEVVSWPRGTWDEGAAAHAWGAARSIVLRHPESVRALFSELAAIRREEGIRRFPDGTWEVVVGYEVPAERQREVLARHLGRDFLEEWTDDFRSGGKSLAKLARSLEKAGLAD